MQDKRLKVEDGGWRMENAVGPHSFDQHFGQLNEEDDHNDHNAQNNHIHYKDNVNENNVNNNHNVNDADKC